MMPNAKLRLAASVSGRFLTFVVLVGLSIPLSAELATVVPAMLPELGISEGQFGRVVDDYVLNLMANWPLLALAPTTLVNAIVGSLPENGAIFWSCVGWAPFGLAYAWATRNRQMFLFVLSVYPFVWVIGIILRLILGAASGS